ncbi:MAG: hypothetical protein DHS20C15_26640 [Planctomycetota bacterium]|nr:MAG: hypothetical protein DHS20C15_26640 [Planctomycetota bacterium]
MSALRDLLLVGGGHAHVQVLRAWAMRPEPNVRLTLLVDTPLAVYSGMVPGCVAGQYRAEELEIDVRPLARRAGARVIHAACTGVEPEARRVLIDGRPSLPYDLASFDVGSRVAGLDAPGVREHAVPTRPIGRFVARLEERLAERSVERAVVVGAGAAGVELAFALQARGLQHVTLLDAGDEPVAELPAALRARVRAAAAARGLVLRFGERVESVESDAVVLRGGERLPADLVLWVTGASAHPLFASSGLALHDGYLRVSETLQVLDRPELFAVGDAAHFDPRPLPKAGVYAVRQGPVLTHNLRAALRGRNLRRYRPQHDFLALINLGDGSALGSKWSRAFEGRWVFSLKDRIDRRFMRRFRVLGEAGALTPDFPEMPGMDEMVCGGCAAKVAPARLERVLGGLPDVHDDDVLIGLAEREDAAVVRLGEQLVVSSVDAFRAFTDDPYVVGEIAAVNAASDLWAKGVRPRFAQALVSVEEGDEESLHQVLAGARAVFDSAGISLVGGHSTLGELSVGFALFGGTPSVDSLWRTDRLAVGDRLLLTKPLGTGVLFHADMRGQARGPWIDEALAHMRSTHMPLLDELARAGVRAVTDVTGFGLAGHLIEMCQASSLSARLSLRALPLLAGARELLERGLRSTAHPANAELRKLLSVKAAAQGQPCADVLFDPQTAGGLLVAVPAASAEALLQALRAAGASAAALVGEVLPRAEAVLELDA